MAKWHLENSARPISHRSGLDKNWAIAYCGIYFSLKQRRVKDDICSRCRKVQTKHYYRTGTSYLESIYTPRVARQPKLPKQIEEKEFALNE